MIIIALLNPKYKKMKKAVLHVLHIKDIYFLQIKGEKLLETAKFVVR